jgi:methionine-rich copper-binding protein CopC
VRLLLLVAALLVAPSSGWAHAFPDHSDPRVGHTLDAPPPAVRIWFDGAIEPVFSTIRVESADKQRVDMGDGRVDPKDPDPPRSQRPAAAARPVPRLLERHRA